MQVEKKYTFRDAQQMYQKQKVGAGPPLLTRDHT